MIGEADSRTTETLAASSPKNNILGEDMSLVGQGQRTCANKDDVVLGHIKWCGVHGCGAGQTIAGQAAARQAVAGQAGYRCGTEAR